ncbi:MAG TPA: hypothetical protein VL486_10980 [Verrucomicrobiae bacterium]|nr:hypothetical protein [Verrucomicrobiae bacterium]
MVSQVSLKLRVSALECLHTCVAHIFLQVPEHPRQTVCVLRPFLRERRQSNVVGIRGHGGFSVFPFEQVRRARVHMVQPRLPPIATQIVLEDFVELPEVVVVGCHLQGSEKVLPPLRSERRCLPAELHRQPDDFADVRRIGLLRRAVMCGMGQRLSHSA